nr:MAG TPA: hypothetical protein [Caudoviricetes sp.]
MMIHTKTHSIYPEGMRLSHLLFFTENERI